MEIFLGTGTAQGQEYLPDEVAKQLVADKKLEKGTNISKAEIVAYLQSHGISNLLATDVAIVLRNMFGITPTFDESRKMSQGLISEMRDILGPDCDELEEEIRDQFPVWTDVQIGNAYRDAVQQCFNESRDYLDELVFARLSLMTPAQIESVALLDDVLTDADCRQLDECTKRGGQALVESWFDVKTRPHRWRFLSEDVRSALTDIMEEDPPPGAPWAMNPARQRLMAAVQKTQAAKAAKAAAAPAAPAAAQVKQAAKVAAPAAADVQQAAAQPRFAAPGPPPPPVPHPDDPNAPLPGPKPADPRQLASPGQEMVPVARDPGTGAAPGAGDPGTGAAPGAGDPGAKPSVWQRIKSGAKKVAGAVGKGLGAGWKAAKWTAGMAAKPITAPLGALNRATGGRLKAAAKLGVRGLSGTAGDVMFGTLAGPGEAPDPSKGHDVDSALQQQMRAAGQARREYKLGKQQQKLAGLQQKADIQQQRAAIRQARWAGKNPAAMAAAQQGYDPRVPVTQQPYGGGYGGGYGPRGAGAARRRQWPGSG